MPLRDAIQRLFDGSIVASSPNASGFSDRELAFPPANMTVNQDSVEIEFGVPGMEPDDVDVSISRDTVTISGEAKHREREKRGQTVVEEFWAGRFQRSFVLPFPVAADKAEADLENGVLHLTLPRSEESKPLQNRGQQDTVGERTPERRTAVEPPACAGFAV